MNNKNITLSLIIAIGIISRLVYHIPNFTPILSICIFSGMMFNNSSKMLIIPMLCMIFSDFFIGYHSTIFFVYFSLILIIFLGKLISNKPSFIKLLSSVFLSSMIFFLITNFGVWVMQSGFYEKNIIGLINCYVLALPFLKNSFISNLIFTPFLIYSYNYITNKYPVLINV